MSAHIARRHGRARILAGLLLTLCGCAGSARGPLAPLTVAGSLCSGVPGLSTEPPSPAQAAQPSAPRALIALITDSQPSELVVVDLNAQRVRWRRPLSAAARPEILEDVVVTTTADKTMVGYDLVSGARRFTVRFERPLWLGAAQSGRRIVFTTSSASWDPRERGSSLTAIDAGNGGRLWERRVPYSLGRPVTRAGRAFVVSDHADLWTVELASGADAGCGRLGGNTIEWLAAGPGPHGLSFGATEARGLGPDGVETQPALELARPDLPGRPLLWESSYQPLPAARSAHGRVSVIAPLRVVAPGAAPSLQRDGFYFVFFRDVFGFHADGSLAWARLLESDVVRAEATDAGLALVTEGGLIQVFDADSGLDRSGLRLPLRVASADLAAPYWPATATAAGAPALQDSLNLLARDTDARMLPARLLAIDELARLDSPSVTRDLLEIYSGANTPAGLRDRIAKRLRERKVGVEHLVLALAQHEDFLDERPAPPLRAIVPALVEQRETRAVPGLIDQLFDPDTNVADLRLLVAALDALGSDDVREPLARFFNMYRADSALAGDASALALAAKALLARPNPATRKLLDRALASESTSPALRAELASVLTVPEAPPAASEPAAVEPTPAAAAQPERLSLEQLRSELDAPQSVFQPCMQYARARTPKLHAVRLWFVAQADGAIRDVRVQPDDGELARCLEGQLLSLRVSAGPSPSPKQLVSYRLTLQPIAAKANAPAPAAGADEFWTLSQQRSPKDARVSHAPPWWQDKNPLFMAIDVPASSVEAPASASGVRAAAGSTPPAKSPAPDKPDPQPPASSQPSAAEDAWWLPSEAK